MRRWLSLASLIVSLAAVVLLAVLWARSQAGWASVRWRAREGDVFELWVAEARAGSVGMAWCRVTAEPSVHGGSDYTGGFSIASDQQMIVRWRAEPGQRVRVWFEDESPAWMVDWSRERRARWPASWEMGTFGHEQRTIVRGFPEAAATLRWERRHVRAPLWTLLLTAGTWPAVVAGRFVARRAREMHRRRGGLCLECGYDLRGSSGGRCPECGTAAELGRRSAEGAVN